MPAWTRFVAALLGPLDPHKPAEKMELTGDGEFRFLTARNVALSHAGESATRAGLTLRRRTCPLGQERGGMSNRVSFCD